MALNPIQQTEAIKKVHDLKYFKEHGGEYASCIECGQNFAVNEASYNGEDFEDLEPLDSKDELLCDYNQ